MTQDDKFENLQRLYQYAKQRNLPESLVTNLLHEILMLSIKLDNYKEDLFKEYIKRPLERNYNLKKDFANKKQNSKQYSQWNSCLQSV